MGSPWAFLLAVGIIILWALTGWYFNFSNTWQLVINTGTTIVTFLMVFLIQNTQNRDSHAVNLKLDELIKALKPARDSFIDIEDQTDDKLDKLQDEFRNFREKGEKKAKI
jgi:low affinity Fe/Cu permease